MKLRLLILLSSLSFLAQAQRMPGDSILAHERSIDRPITLHAGQFRITGAYDASLHLRRFDERGETVSLRDAGTASIRNHYTLDLKYGITEVIQVSAAIGATGHTIKGRAHETIANEGDAAVSHRVERKYSGIGDLFVGADLRMPLKTRKYDIAFSFGAYLPTGASEPPRPEHAFSVSEQGGSALHQYVYRYHNPPGRGVTVVSFGARAKYRTPRWAFSSGVDYKHGLKDGASSEWKHQLTPDGTFTYRKVPLTYRLPDSFDYFLEVEFQPSPSVDIFLNASGFTAYDGWVSRQDDLKVAVPYQTVVVCSPGVEILITPRFWVRERLDIALAGTNHDAILGAETTLMYNLFPCH